jgi:hypothetical protein
MEIQIQRESSQCMLCQQPFAHEQKHYSLLKLSDNVFSREDYCEECWPKLSSENGDTSIYSYWETKYRDPAVARATPEAEFLPLLQFFYEQVAAGEEGKSFSYVCALVLRRQKIFRFIREEKDEAGKAILVFHDKYHDVQVKVADATLTEGKFREVKQKLEEFLSQKEKIDE